MPRFQYDSFFFGRRKNLPWKIRPCGCLSVPFFFFWLKNMRIEHVGFFFWSQNSKLLCLFCCRNQTTTNQWICHFVCVCHRLSPLMLKTAWWWNFFASYLHLKWLCIFTSTPNSIEALSRTTEIQKQHENEKRENWMSNDEKENEPNALRLPFCHHFSLVPLFWSAQWSRIFLLLRCSSCLFCSSLVAIVIVVSFAFISIIFLFSKNISMSYNWDEYIAIGVKFVVVSLRASS